MVTIRRAMSPTRAPSPSTPSPSQMPASTQYRMSDVKTSSVAPRCGSAARALVTQNWKHASAGKRGSSRMVWRKSQLP